MQFQLSLLLTGTIALGVSAAPACLAAAAASVAPAAAATTSSSATGVSITPQLLETITNNGIQCTTTTDGGECATADRAATALSKAFTKYNNTPGQQAALLALMLFESDNFEYNHNISPGRPGQGTRSMMMPNNIKKYATAVLGADKVAAASTDDAILALVQGDDLSFASASWYLSTCPQSIQDGLSAATMAGWNAYLVNCVGTTDVPARDAIYVPTVQAIMGRAPQ